MADDESSPEDATGQLIARLNHLEDVLRMQTARLHAIEQRLDIDFQPRQQYAAEPPLRHEAATTKPNDETIRVRPSLSPASQPATPSRTSSLTFPTSDWQATSQTPRQSAPQTPQNEKNRFDVETLIGGSWFNWIGIIAIAFGVAFFLKYAFDNQWIGATGRVVLGASVGLGILVAGEVMRRRGLPQFAYVISGGGILILYLSVYAAYDFYKLIGQVPAFVLMTVVTATAVSLSARYNALPIAILGLLGGFLTPILISTGQDNQAGLFSYIALLDAGVLALAYKKEWRSLNYMSFILTLLMIVGWMQAFYVPPKLWLTVFFLTLFFLLFSLLAILHNVLKRRFARWFDISLVITNATFYFGVSYKLLDDAGYGAALSSFALVMSAFYVLLFFVAHRLYRADGLLLYSYLGAAVTFFTLTVAIQLDQQWVTIGWAMEGLVLTWVGLRSGTDAPRRAALVVFVVAIMHWFGADVHDFAFNGGEVFLPLLNRRAASCAVLVAALATSAWLYWQGRAKIEERERATIIILLIIAANAMAFTLLSVDVNDYFRAQIARVSSQPDASNMAARLENTREFSLSALWTIYGTAALVLGIVRRSKPLRFAALLLLGVTVGKVLIFDLAYYSAPWHAPLFNQTFVAFALLIAALVTVVYAYTRAGHIEREERAAVVPTAIVIANLLAIIALSAEALGHFEAQMLTSGLTAYQSRDLRLAQQLSLSVIWTVYGGVMLVVGIKRRSRLLRVMALLLLGLTTLKVFFWDLAWLDRIYRIISFIVLGAILLAVSYLYQKGQQLTKRAEENG